MITTSRTMYGKALLNLNKALQDPEEGYASDTLSATVLLSFYEMITCTERFSWIRHAGGAANLMRIRGPERHRMGIDATVFLACRYSLIMQSFQTRKKCFLAEPGWRQLSRDLNESSTQRSAFHDAREEVFQEVVEYPAYIVHAVDYMHDGVPQQQLLQELVRRGHQYRSSYKGIHNRMVEALQEAGQEPTKTPSSLNDKLFPIVYQYPGILVASFYCGYWTGMSMMNVVLIGLESKLQSLSVSPAASPSIALEFGDHGVKPYMSRAMESLPDRTTPPELWSLAAPERGSAFPVAAALSPKDYPTMSAEDTLKRRNL